LTVITTMRASVRITTLVLAVWSLATPAWAFVTRLTPLKNLLAESQSVFVAKVDRLDRDRPSVALTVSEDLKGKAVAGRLAVDLTGDAEARQHDHTPQLLKRLAPDLPVVVFATQRGNRHLAFAYTNGTWFRLLGEPEEGTVRWRLAHGEPYLRRTFKGTTAELRQAVVDALAGKKDPPAPDPKEPPGFGPEVKPAPGAGRAGPAGGPLFAVIPLLGLGGPLVLLALLVPTVFGGALGQLRRWQVFLTVVSLASLLWLISAWLAPPNASAPWSRPGVLWLATALVTLAGLVWACRRRHVPAPRRIELVLLVLLSLLGLAALGVTAREMARSFTPAHGLLLALCAGPWAGLLLKLGRPQAATEPAMLAAMLVTTAVLLPAWWRGQPTERVVVAWTFAPEGRGRIVSQPLVTAESVYVAAAHDDAFEPRGTLYGLDRATGRRVWAFDDGGAMKPVFSSPGRDAAGGLYVGEGFHQDEACKLYCLDAGTGRKRWHFETASHVESSPVVADGRVFVGAGADGLWCLDARTGAPHWHFRGPHVDMRPVVVGDRVYAGSGYGTCEVFCLDAGTGAVRWRTRTDLPVFASPEWSDGRLYCGLGNGDLLTSDARPAGAVLCLDADTGQERWRRDVPDAVHGTPRQAAGRVFFGSRDHGLYCADAATGCLLGRRDLGSPVVASPVVVNLTDRDTRVYAVASAGRVVCLDAGGGLDPAWEYDLRTDAQAPVQVLSAPAVWYESTGQRVRLYLGAEVQSVVSRPVLYCLEDRGRLRTSLVPSP
jgi:outer membrane protein assembly factor BamB